MAVYDKHCRLNLSPPLAIKYFLLNPAVDGATGPPGVQTGFDIVGGNEFPLPCGMMENHPGNWKQLLDLPVKEVFPQTISSASRQYKALLTEIATPLTEKSHPVFLYLFQVFKSKPSSAIISESYCYKYAPLKKYSPLKNWKRSILLY